LAVTGNATISGDLTVSGTTTYINTTVLNVGDNIITLNADFASGTPTENAGIEVRRGSSPTRQFYWSESGQEWYADAAFEAAGNIIGQGNIVISGTIDTGQGATEVHLMNQNLRTTDNVTHATITATNGVSVTGGNLSVSAGNITISGTIDTGQGATEVHLMNQNVRTTDNVTFGNLTSGRHIISTTGADWATSGVIGTAIDALHLWPSNVANFGSAITFGARDSGPTTNANAGIYVRSGGGFGTTMALATTDSYAAGSQVAVFIDAGGNTIIRRGSFTANNTIIESSANDQGITLNATDNSWKYIGFSWSNARRSYIGVNSIGEPEWGTDNGNTFRFVGSSTLTIGGNIALHAGNYTSYTVPIGGSWYGVNTPGSRWYGFSVNGGEIVFGRDLPNNGQMGILIDGAYLAGENNGFWSLPSNNDWNGRRGFNWDGTQLNFTTNSPIALFSDLRAPIFRDSNDTGFFLDPNTTATSLRIAGGIKQDNLVGRPYAVWGATSATGAVIIKFPGGVGNYGMIHAEIDIYEYNGNAACTVIVGGHNWNGAWYNINAEVVGQTDKQVRVGVKDGRYCIVIGSGGSSWSYGQVVLRKIQNGAYYSGVMDVAEGYSVAIESDSYTNISGDLRNLRTPASFTAGGNITAGSGMFGQIYYDSNNTGFYADPNSTSRFSTLNVDQLNTGNYINIGYTLNNESVATSAFRGIDWHTQGDPNYYIGKPAGAWTQPLNIRFFTGIRLQSHQSYGGTQFLNINTGTTVMTVNNGNNHVEVNTDIRSPIFYDLNNTGFFSDQASTSRYNVLNLNSGWIGGTTTNGQSHFQWEGASFRNPGDHSPILLIRNDNATTGINGFRPALAIHNNSGGDQTTVGISFTTAEGATGAGNSVALAGIIAKKESSGNVGGWSPGSLTFFTKNFGTRNDAQYIGPDGRIGFGTTDFSFTASDNSSVIGGGINNNRLFVNGSIQLLGNNDAIVIGRGTSSFFKDEEIGFGWGGGWHMTDGTFLRVRNGGSVQLYTPGIMRADGDMRAPVFYDQNDTQFYIDPNGGSRLRGNFEFASDNNGSTSYVAAAIELRETSFGGSSAWLPPRLGFHWGGVVASQIGIESSGRISILNNPGNGYENLIANQYFGAIYYDSNNTGFFLDPNGTSNLGGLTLAANVSTGRASYGSGTANLVLLSDATFGRATIDFRSGVNFPSDGAQIYYETATNLSSGETSRLVIRTENDADDSILIRGGFIILNSTTVDGGSTNPGVRTQYNGNERLLTYSDHTAEVSSFRAPIFYDSNNTAFYTDPASTSIVDIMEFGGDWAINTSNGSKIFGMFVPDGKYQTRNWHAGDGNYVWSGMQYVTGMSDSPIGSYSHRGTGDWQGWRQNGWVPIDRTKTYKVSAWIRTISGNPFCFLSFTQAGWDYSQPDNGGWGQPYYFAGAPPSTWTEYTMTIGPAGSGAQYSWYGYARFMQLGFLHNYLYSGFNGRAEFIGFKIEEVDNTLAANTVVLGDIFASRFVDNNDGTFFIDPANSDLSIRVAGEISNSNYQSGFMQPGALNIGRTDRDYGWDGTSWASDIRSGILANCSELWEFNIHDSGDSVQSVFRYNGGDQLLMGRNIGWGAMYVEAARDFRAPIYYDSNNTGYYIDPNGYSSFGSAGLVMEITKLGTGPNSRALQVANNQGDNSWGIVAEFRVNGGPGGDRPSILFSNGFDSNTWSCGYGFADSGLFRINYDHGHRNQSWGTTAFYIDRGSNSYSNGSSRAPIFYDLNNTGYYSDPASISVYNQLRFGTSSNVGRFDAEGTWGVRFRTNDGYIWFGPANTGHAHIYTDRPNFYFNVPLTVNDGSYINTGDIRSAIFYDRNDTTYYTDLNGGSYIRGMLEVAAGHGESEIRLTARGNELGTGQTSSMCWWVSEPCITWNDGGFGYNVTNDCGSPSGFGRLNGNYGQAYMRFTTAGHLLFYNTNTSGTRFSTMDMYSSNYIYVHNYLEAGASLRATIFYDSNNTGFYTDQASTSRYNEIRANKMRADTNGDMGNSGWWAHDVYGQGWGAPHGSFRSLEVSTSGNFSTEPAMFRIHQWGSGSSEFWKPQGTTLFLRETPLSTGGSVKHGNWFTRFFVQRYIETDEDMRAPIFYDANDTGYNIDPTGNSNWQGLTLRGKAQTGLTGKTNWKRPDITGDSNYWTGIMGWGTEDLNSVMTWGSGFFDTWSNPANQPSGTSHWVGVQASHYTNAYNSMYGWQMCGGPISNLRFRNSWPGASGWTTIAMHDRNDASGGALYAGMYYDANDTGFYLDPNSGAANCLRVVGGIHVSVGNVTGNGIILADDGDIVDLNDGYCAMRFSFGVRVHSANRGGGPVIALRQFGGIIAADNITAYGSPSDARKKENIAPIENALEKVTKLRGVEFDWKENTDEWTYTKIKHDIGFIAQEVQEVEPKLVREGGDGFLGLRDRAIPALLVEAIKELKAELDDARNEIKQLRQELLKK
jgi:hypothetical protein